MLDAGSTTTAINNLLLRALQRSGIYPVDGQSSIITHTHDTHQIWADSAIAWAKLADIELHRGGLHLQHTSNELLVSAITRSGTVIEYHQIEWLRERGLVAVSDLFNYDGTRVQYSNFEDQWLQDMELHLEGTIKGIEIRIGQHWGFVNDDGCLVYEILGINQMQYGDEPILHVRLWDCKRASLQIDTITLWHGNTTLGAGSCVQLAYSELFEHAPTMQLFTRGDTYSPTQVFRKVFAMASRSHAPVSGIRRRHRYITQPSTRITTKIMVTDGSWSQSNTRLGYIVDDATSIITSASAGIIVMDINTGLAVSGYHISVGADIFPQSAYTMELLAAVMAEALARQNGDISTISTDCQSVIDTLSQHPKTMAANPHFPLIAASFIFNVGIPNKVKGHPERQKADSTWTIQDRGIYLADQLARSPVMASLPVDEYPASEVLDTVTRWVPWLWQQNGITILNSIQNIISKKRGQLYLQHRDINRSSRNLPSKWAQVKLSVMASHWKQRKQNLVSSALATKIAFDWVAHSANRNKGTTIDPDVDADSCKLCGSIDDAQHWMLHCSHHSMATLRVNWISKLHKMILGFKPTAILFASLLRDIAIEDFSGWRVLSGAWNQRTSEQLFMVIPSLREYVTGPDTDIQYLKRVWTTMTALLSSMLCQLHGLSLIHI